MMHWWLYTADDALMLICTGVDWCTDAYKCWWWVTHCLLCLVSPNSDKKWWCNLSVRGCSQMVSAVRGGRGGGAWKPPKLDGVLCLCMYMFRDLTSSWRYFMRLYFVFRASWHRPLWLNEWCGTPRPFYAQNKLFGFYNVYIRWINWHRGPRLLVFIFWNYLTEWFESTSGSYFARNRYFETRVC